METRVRTTYRAATAAVILIAATIALSWTEAAPAQASSTSTVVSHEASRLPGQVPLGIKVLPQTKLSNTQVANFATMFCVNVNLHGWDWTTDAFNEVVHYDGIPKGQASLIEALASNYC